MTSVWNGAVLPGPVGFFAGCPWNPVAASLSTPAQQHTRDWSLCHNHSEDPVQIACWDSADPPPLLLGPPFSGDWAVTSPTLSMWHAVGCLQCLLASCRILQRQASLCPRWVPVGRLLGTGDWKKPGQVSGLLPPSGPQACLWCSQLVPGTWLLPIKLMRDWNIHLAFHIFKLGVLVGWGETMHLPWPKYLHLLPRAILFFSMERHWHAKVFKTSGEGLLSVAWPEAEGCQSPTGNRPQGRSKIYKVRAAWAASVGKAPLQYFLSHQRCISF